jgi:condensin complex subunit 3
MVNARPRTSSASYLETIPSQLAPIFDQVQHTTANHRKNLVSLRKIQEQCSSVTEPTPKGLKLVGEKAFNTIFIEMVNRILGVKKGVSVADRVVKFVASYVAYATEQGKFAHTLTD